MKKVNVAIVGATGMVGRTFIKVLEDRKESPNRDFLLLKSKFGTRINDTLED
jgi:aspartate-semialdehyde dehydrogenase